MRVSAITNVNYKGIAAKRQNVAKREDAPNSSDVNFRGGKGAVIGGLSGLGYLAVVSAISGPFFPITLAGVALCAGTGAVAGHNIQEEWKKTEEENKNNK